MLVALPMRSRGIGSLVTVVSGTKISPNPAPCSISGHQKFQNPTSRLNVETMNIAIAVAVSPMARSLRASTFPVSIPTTGMNMNDAMPRGRLVTPAWVAVYPSNSCIRSGRSTVLP